MDSDSDLVLLLRTGWLCLGSIRCLQIWQFGSKGKRLTKLVLEFILSLVRNPKNSGCWITTGRAKLQSSTCYDAGVWLGMCNPTITDDMQICGFRVFTICMYHVKDSTDGQTQTI